MILKHITSFSNIAKRSNCVMRILVWKCKNQLKKKQNTFYVVKKYVCVYICVYIYIYIYIYVCVCVNKEHFLRGAKMPPEPLDPKHFPGFSILRYGVCVSKSFLTCSFIFFRSIVVNLKSGSRLTFWWTYPFSYSLFSSEVSLCTKNWVLGWHFYWRFYWYVHWHVCWHFH